MPKMKKLNFPNDFIHINMKIPIIPNKPIVNTISIINATLTRSPDFRYIPKKSNTKVNREIAENAKKKATSCSFSISPENFAINTIFAISMPENRAAMMKQPILRLQPQQKLSCLMHIVIGPISDDDCNSNLLTARTGMNPEPEIGHTENKTTAK